MLLGQDRGTGASRDPGRGASAGVQAGVPTFAATGVPCGDPDRGVTRLLGARRARYREDGGGQGQQGAASAKLTPCQSTRTIGPLEITREEHVSEQRYSRINYQGATWAAAGYTAIVFVFAFAVGTIRVTQIMPRIGAIPAVLLEAPIVLAVSWRVSLWCNRRFRLGCEPRTRTLMGVLAFMLLMLLELSFSVFIFGETVGHYLVRTASISGAIGLATQVCFAAIPWIQCRLSSGTVRHSSP